MLVDLIKSIDLLNKITKFAKESGLETRYDEMRLKQKELTKEAKQKLVSVLPETVKKTLEESKKITINNEVVEKAKDTISKIILIDSNKSTSSNYDENGRPISIDEEKKK
jgi:DNA-binding protein YbaB